MLFLVSFSCHLSSLRNAQPTFVCASLSRAQNKPQFVPGEWEGGPSSSALLLVCADVNWPCSVLIHSDLLMPALHLVPGDGPSSGDALGLQGTLSGPKSAREEEVLFPTCVFTPQPQQHWVLRERSLDSGVQTPAQPLASL